MGVYPWSIAAAATIARLNLEVLEIRRLVLFRFRGSANVTDQLQGCR